jgi:hypothetical protein
MTGVDVRTSKVVSVSPGARINDTGGPRLGLSGNGTAVVEMVVAIAPDANVGWSMCKNWKGPASAELVRLTEGSVSVGQMINAGTSQVSTASQCENSMVGTLTRPDVIGPVRWPARRDPRALTVAAYHPWYDAETLAEHDFGDNPVGPADTNDPDQVAQSVELAKANGVDSFAIAYVATNRYDAPIEAVYDAADVSGGFAPTLMFDLDATFYEYNYTLPDAALDMGMQAVARWATHPSQLKVGGKPVMFVYAARRVTAQRWQAALARLEAATGIEPFVIADDAALGSPGLFLYSNVNSATSLASWAKDWLLRTRLAPSLAATTPPFWVGPTLPGYDDSRIQRNNHWYVNRDGGRFYDTSWTTTLATLPDWVFVGSWNEFHEQSHIFPGTTTGTTAIEQTKTWSDRFAITG